MPRPRILIVLALLLTSTAARADFTYAGTLDSWEWLVDSSATIATGRVEKFVDQDKLCIVRLSSMLKHPKDAPLKPGGELKVTTRAWRQPAVGVDALVFVPAGDSDAVTFVQLPKNGDAKPGYLLPDKFGKVVRKTDELIKKISDRIQKANAARPRRAYFVYSPGSNEVDTNEEYYDIRVPPDADLKKVIEKYARVNHSSQAIYYRFYSGRTAEEFKADRERDRDHVLREAKARLNQENRTFSYQSYVTYPRYDFVIHAPDGKHVAILERHRAGASPIESDDPSPAPGVMVYETGKSKLVVPIDKYHAYESGAQALFSADGKQFACLDKEGVSIFDLATGKRVSGALGWKVTAATTPYPRQFTFSPDGNYLALNLHNGLAGEGSAIVVWRTDTGEAVYVKSKNWDLKRELRFVGFGPRSDCIHVAESTFYLLKERREASFIMTGWHRWNPDGEKNPVNGKLRAQLDKDKLSIVDTASGKVHAAGGVGWKIANDSARPSQFTFSRDGKFLALNLNSGQAGTGSAIVVWQTDTGEAVYVKSKNWELKREFALVAFDPYCNSIHLTESDFWQLKERKETPLIAGDWVRPNRDGETDPAAVRPWVNPVEVPGVPWNASPSQKK